MVRIGLLRDHSKMGLRRLRRCDPCRLFLAGLFSGSYSITAHREIHQLRIRTQNSHGRFPMRNINWRHWDEETCRRSTSAAHRIGPVTQRRDGF